MGVFSNLPHPPAQGCFEHIGHAIDSYTWGISWFGFAILMWTVRGGEPTGWVGWGWGAESPHLAASSPAPGHADSHVFLHHALRDRRGRQHTHPGLLRTLLLLPPLGPGWLPHLSPPNLPSPYVLPLPRSFSRFLSPTVSQVCPETPGLVCTYP